MKKILLMAAMLVGISSSANEASLITNPITGTNPNTANPYTTGQVVDPNITASGIGRGNGISGTNANDRYNANSWTSTNIDLTAYFTFTITPNAGYFIDFTNFVYTGQASASGPTSFAFRSSADTFTNDIGTPTATGATITLTSLSNVTSATEFRLYAWGTGTGTFSVNDFTFNGTVTAVPEPTAILMVGSLIGLVGIKRRRK